MGLNYSNHQSGPFKSVTSIATAFGHMSKILKFTWPKQNMVILPYLYFVFLTGFAVIH